MWDHAAGSVILECAGGVVTDIKGKRLDFSHGAKLVDNYGIFASLKENHSQWVSMLSSLFALYVC